MYLYSGWLGKIMKKMLVGTILSSFALVFPLPATAGVNVGVSVSLPPLIVFSAPPEVVVIPETYVYVVPDAREVGGGVRGKGAGIARGTMTPVGPTTKGSHPFIEGYRRAGGMTTGIVAGEDIHGTTSGSLTRN
jgi:hypothetical protein